MDRIFEACEDHQLPAPLITANESSTKVTLYPIQEFKHMSKAAKIRACYFHACLKFAGDEVMTNQSLRERLGIEARNYSYASKIIRETLAAQLIKPSFETKSGRLKSYIPYWAT